MGLGVSFKLAPGVRVRASTRGVRASVGPRSARVHVGAGGTRISSGIGPVTVSSGVGQARAVNRSRPPSPSLADLDRQARAAQKEAQRAAVMATEQALTTLHLTEFPIAAPVQVQAPASPTPAQVSALAKSKRKDRTRGVSLFDRERRREIAAACRGEATADLQRRRLADLIRRQREQLEEDRDWADLLEHEPTRVVEQIDAAFADNDSTSTCIDADTDPATGRRYVTCLIMYGSPEMIPETTPAVTPSGKPTLRKRTKTDRNALYLLAMASTVLATIKEALATSPSTDEVRVIVVRDGRNHLLGAGNPGLLPIYQGSLPRRAIDGCHWSRVDPVRMVLEAEDAGITLKGATKEVVAIPIRDPDLQHLLNQVQDAISDSRR